MKQVGEPELSRRSTPHPGDRTIVPVARVSVPGQRQYLGHPWRPLARTAPPWRTTNMRAAMRRPADDARRDDDGSARQPLLGDVRTRVLASFFILLVVSTAVSLLVLRQVLISRIGNDVRETLDGPGGAAPHDRRDGTGPGDGQAARTATSRRSSPPISSRSVRADDGFLATFIRRETQPGRACGYAVPGRARPTSPPSTAPARGSRLHPERRGDPVRRRAHHRRRADRRSGRRRAPCRTSATRWRAP